MLGTIVQVFSPSYGLCSTLPRHSMVAAQRHEFRCGSDPSSPWDLPFKGLGKSCALVLCDHCGEWTSGAGLCRRLVDPWCLLKLLLADLPRSRFELTLSSRVPHVFRQTSSTIMLHQLANSPIIHHGVFDDGPSTPHFSLPMTITLDVFDGSVTDSLADVSSSWFDESLPTSTVRSLSRDTFTDHRCAVLRSIFNDDSEITAFETEIRVSMIPPASARNSCDSRISLVKIPTLCLKIQFSSA